MGVLRGWAFSYERGTSVQGLLPSTRDHVQALDIVTENEIPLVERFGAAFAMKETPPPWSCPLGTEQIWQKLPILNPTGVKTPSPRTLP